MVSIHRALLAGATLAQVADAMGMTCAGAAERWRCWADGQRQLGQQVPGPAGSVRCASRISIRARVPAASPCLRRAASQYRWWAW